MFDTPIAGLQGSLLDLDDDLGLRALGPAVRRTVLAHGAWVDVRPGWVTGSDELFRRLLPGGGGRVAWEAETRRMYDRVLPTPRLLRFYGERDPLPDAVLDDARDALSRHYAAELHEPFRTAGMCLYRDHRDSVAWHGDRIGRGSTHDTMVAIVSVGSARTLTLRPAGGGSALRFRLGHGDLLVMGGSCQRTWEHAIPKSSTPVGPRISIQFRPRGVR